MVCQQLRTLLSAILAIGLPDTPAEPPKILSAYYDASEVCFDAPVPIDWRNVADHHFSQFSLSQPDMAAILDGYSEIYGGTRFLYPAPLPSDIASLHYTLFYENGVTEIHPHQLRGEVRYVLDHSRRILGPPNFFGQVCARASTDIQDAGFVVISHRPQHWQTTSAPFDNRRVPPRVQIGSGELAVPETKQTIAEIRAAYVVALPDGPRYLFVRRADDVDCKRVCCTNSYDLFDLTDASSRVAWTAYNCDP